MHHRQVTKEYEIPKVSNATSFLTFQPLRPHFAGNRHVGVHVHADQDRCLLLQLRPSAGAVTLIHVVHP